jgi:hypothetical protein
MLIVVGILSMVFTQTGILRCQHCRWWYLLVIQKGLALLHIMSYGAMDLAPLFNIIGTPEVPLFLLL